MELEKGWVRCLHYLIYEKRDGCAVYTISYTTSYTKKGMGALFTLSHIRPDIRKKGWVCCLHYLIYDKKDECTVCTIPYTMKRLRGYCLRSCVYPIYDLLTKGDPFCALAPIPYATIITTSVNSEIS